MKAKRHPLYKTIAVAALSLATTHFSYADVNYGEALQKSIYFYEAQQAGQLPEWNRVEWRADSVLNDGADAGVDLTGGWFDAGDHVKFGFPMAASATMLAWGVIEYPEAYEQSGQMAHIKNNLRFVADYFLNAHTAPNELYGQVGKGSDDHSWWGAPEVLELTTRKASVRPAYKIDSSCPGSDLAGETSAALASISMVFRQDDPAYAGRLLSHARELYDFAKTYQGKYSDCITDAVSFYNSWSGYKDELVWSAAWMYNATGEARYLDNAKADYNNLSTEQSGEKSYKWTHAWDDKAYGSYILMAKLTGEDEYKTDAQRYLDFWTVGYNGDRVTYTPGGQAQLSQWGSNRYTANTSFIALLYSDFLKTNEPGSEKISTYYDFAVSQIEYIMGDNPNGISYQIGYDDTSPSNPHHRGAHGSWRDSLEIPVQSRHLLVGALVGGPKSGDGFVDDRGDFITNEVATDYNAAFTGALARLYLDFGGEPIPESQFPQPEKRDREYFVEAKLNASSGNFVEISAVAHNRSAWPAANGDDVTYRYFINLSSEFAKGHSESDIEVRTNYNQANPVSGLISWGDPADNIYYIEVDFNGVDFFPGGQGESKRETQFRIAIKGNNNDWDNSDDPSWDAYTNTAKDAPKIAMYKGGELVFGQEPSLGCGGTTGVNCLPTAQDVSVATASGTAIAIDLRARDSDGSIVDYQFSAPTSGVLSGAGDSRTYTPNNGFAGVDTFDYTAIDDQGGISNTAQIRVTVDNPIVPSVSISSPASGSRVSIDQPVTVNFSLQDATSAKILLNGGQIASGITTSAYVITAPSTSGNFLVEVIAQDSSGEDLSASDSVTLNAVAVPVNTAPIASFVASSSNLTVNTDASDSSDAQNDNLTYRWSFDGTTKTGITATHTFASAGTYSISLTVNDGESSNTTSQPVTVTAASSIENVTCEFSAGNTWNTGFVATVKITNNSSGDLNGWQVGWALPAGFEIEDSWNATLTGSNPYTATPVAWNTIVKAGQFREFGVKGSKPNGASVPTIDVTGSVCN